MVTLAKKKGVWYGAFRIDGRQKWVKIGRVSKTSAKEVLRKLEESQTKKSLD